MLSVPLKDAEAPRGVSLNESVADPLASLSPSVLRDAQQLDLSVVASSPAGTALVAALALRVSSTEDRGNERRAAGLAKLHGALGAIVGGALRHWAASTTRAVFHPRTPSGFTGQPVSHRSFTATVDTLVFLGFLHTAAGVQFAIDWGDGLQSSKGWASRLWPSQSLLDLATAHGVTLASAREAFTAKVLKGAKAPKILHPIKLTALAGGARRKSQQRLPRQPLTISPSDTQAAALAAVATLGKGSPVARWAAGAGHGSDARQVGDAIMRRHAFLAEPWRAASHLEHLASPRRVLPHFLMGLESTAITLAMGRLRGAGVLALPVHDSLIVPATHSDLAVKAMRDAWAKVAGGVIPSVTVRRPAG
jgi:hypothetical protein